MISKNILGSETSHCLFMLFPYSSGVFVQKKQEASKLPVFREHVVPCTATQAGCAEGGTAPDRQRNCRRSGLRQRADLTSSKQWQRRYRQQQDKAGRRVHRKPDRRTPKGCSRKGQSCFFGKYVPAAPVCSRCRDS